MTAELDVAQGVAREAGSLLLSYFGSERLKTSEKRYLDVVTQADTEAEALIVAALQDAFPEDAIVGEEGTRTSSATGRTWHVDPLDGTFNFSRTLPFWCVSIALADGGRSLIGAVYDPIRDEMFTAIAGRGAWLNGEPVTSSDVTDPMESVLQLSINYDRSVIESSVADFNALVPHVKRIRNLGALALEMCYVAAGRLDAVAQRGSNSWDYAAAVTLARETGCTLSDIDGADFDLFTDSCLLAGTQALHHALLEKLKTNQTGSPQ